MKIPIKDIDIRNLLMHNLHTTSELSLIKCEMPVGYGDARVDIAVISDNINGIEIKSEADTLYRLSKQIEVYNRLFKKILLVTCENHLYKAISVIPDFWGVSCVFYNNGVLDVKEIRASKDNCNRDSFTIAQLLRKCETIQILYSTGIYKGIKSKPRYELWRIIGDTIEVDKLEPMVVDILKSRTEW